MRQPAKQPGKRGPKPKPKPNVTLPNPIGKTVLLDRQICSGCQKLRLVTSVDGVIVVVSHLVFVRDEALPRGGSHETCPGSGKPGDGPVVHSAITEPRLA